MSDSIFIQKGICNTKRPLCYTLQWYSKEDILKERNQERHDTFMRETKGAGGFGNFKKDVDEKKDSSKLEQVNEEGPQSFAVKDNYDGNIDN